MFLVGLSQGPPHHYWYIYLDKWLPQKSLRTVCLKILADQFIAAPFFAITFLFGMGILEDKRLSECWSEFTKKFPVVYMVRDKITHIGYIQKGLTPNNGRDPFPPSPYRIQIVLAFLPMHSLGRCLVNSMTVHS